MKKIILYFVLTILILKAIYYDEKAISDSLCDLDSNGSKVKDGKTLPEGYQFISELSKWILRQIECGKKELIMVQKHYVKL